MKKIYILICLLFLLIITGCNISNYSIYEIKINNDAVDKELMHEYLSSNADFSYEAILENTPDLMTRLYNVTPKELKNKCSIYRFSYENCGGLGGETFLIYDNDVYILGAAFGGYGVTELAYRSSNDENKLYYIFSCGSGIHRSAVGAFDFKTKTMSYYGPQLNDDSHNQPFAELEDISFYISGSYLGICKAEISWKNNDTFEVYIIDGENVLNNVKALDFITVDK